MVLLVGLFGLTNPRSVPVARGVVGSSNNVMSPLIECFRLKIILIYRRNQWVVDKSPCKVSSELNKSCNSSLIPDEVLECKEAVHFGDCKKELKHTKSPSISSPSTLNAR